MGAANANSVQDNANKHLYLARSVKLFQNDGNAKVAGDISMTCMGRFAWDRARWTCGNSLVVQRSAM